MRVVQYGTVWYGMAWYGNGMVCCVVQQNWGYIIISFLPTKTIYMYMYIQSPELINIMTNS